jgi:6-phosphogluconate dehydrogenase
VDGQPCVTHIGPGGAGHYVKMVHNGIEYGDMQLICEAYALFKAAGMTADEMADVFDRWNEGELQSYLIQITAKALRQRDPETGQAVVDLILDKAGQKGTGPVDAGERSRERGGREHHQRRRRGTRAVVHEDRTRGRQQLLHGPSPTISCDRATLVAQVHDALYAAKIVSYAQGLDLMRTDEREEGLGAGPGRHRRHLARRLHHPRALPGPHHRGLPRRPGTAQPDAGAVLRRRAQPQPAAWRQVVALAVATALPVPALSASLAYYDSYRCARLPANLLQAQRDFFGAHTYERVDKPAGQWFHTQWPDVIE